MLPSAQFLSCCCIIPHKSQSSFLVRRVPGGYQCLSVRLPQQRLNFFPAYIPAIRQEMRREINLDVTVLRHLQDWDDAQVCVLEVHSADDRLPPDFLWLDNPEQAEWADEHSARAWKAWTSALSAEDTAVLAPWERVGWFAEAAGWMQSRLHQAGYELQGPVEQIKGAWSWSSLLKADTDRGAVYFKADYHRPPQEAAVILKLAERWPLSVPKIIASSAERGWMLMPDFAEDSLETLEWSDYSRAVSQFAQIQRRAAPDLSEWKRLGCPDMTAPALLRLTRQLFADTVILRGGKDGLNREELTQLELKWPQIERLLNQLEASVLPNTISHEDFRAGNVVVRPGGGPLFYDWSGTVITHPLFGINYFLNRMVRTHSEDRFLWRSDLEDTPRRALAAAFLSVWADEADWHESVAEFWLCRRLSGLYEALRCYCDLPFIGTQSPWGAGTLRHIPNALRHLLAALDYQPQSLTIDRLFGQKNDGEA